MAISFPAIPPDQGSSENPTATMISAQFGNGFGMLVPDGRNYLRTIWNPMSWSGLNAASLATLITFLNSMTSGDYTTYTSPMTGQTYYLKLETPYSFPITNQGGQTYSVTTIMKQVFI